MDQKCHCETFYLDFLPILTVPDGRTFSMLVSVVFPIPIIRFAILFGHMSKVHRYVYLLQCAIVEVNAFLDI